MRKQTVWLLIVLVGTFSMFWVVQQGQSVPFQKLLGQVGITVGVAPNPYNTLDDQLNQKQQQLDQEASDLAAQQAAFASSSAQAAPLTTTTDWYLMAAVGVIGILLVLNFYFDWRRSRAEAAVAAAPATSGPTTPAIPSEPEKPKE